MPASAAGKLVFFWACLTGVVAGHAETLFPPPVKGERLVIVAPHPDDEVLGCGGLIQQAVAVGAEVRVIYLTNGDHNQIAFKLYSGHLLHLGAKDYIRFGERRRLEATDAMSLLGLSATNLVFLGYPDWGELQIWRSYWATNKVFTSDATRTNAVPYPEDYGYRHSYQPQSAVADFCAVLRDFKPTRVFVTHPCDANADHRATANFVRLALLQLADEGLQPQLNFYVVHFGDWPKPVHYHPELGLSPPALLLDNGDWMNLPLTPAQTETKYRAILLNQTQTTTREFFLVAFARTNELFATIALDRVPSMPAGPEPDWRKAAHAKILTIVSEHSQLQTNLPAVSVPETIPLEAVDFARQNGDLIVLIGLKNRLGKHTGVHLTLFPYQRGVPFAAMPKVEMNFPSFGNFTVQVNGALVRDSGVIVTSVSNRFVVRVPMRLLGGKAVDHLFAAAQGHWGEIAVDDTAWQLLELPAENEREKHD